jgi:D-serine deaminase-like pyridoxal phosphate-dependent protein
MSRDRGTQAQAVDQGYGLVCAEDGTPLDGFIMSGANQEHGILSWRDGRVDATLEQRFPVGTRLRLLPNHACATGAQFPHYEVLAASGTVARWPRFYGW